MEDERHMLLDCPALGRERAQQAERIVACLAGATGGTLSAAQAAEALTSLPAASRHMLAVALWPPEWVAMFDDASDTDRPRRVLLAAANGTHSMFRRFRELLAAELLPF